MALSPDAEKHKEEGNALYKAGDFYGALGQFDKVTVGHG